MNRAHLWLFFSVLLLACGASLGHQKTRQGNAFGTGFSQVPSNFSVRPNPYEGQPEAVLAGRKLFRRHCAGCHGADARGQGKAPDLHSPVVQGAAPGTLLWFLKNGNLREGMPSWSRLPDERLWQIVSYLKTLK